MLEDRLRKTQEALRRTHLAMCKMAYMVEFPSVPTLKSSIEAITRYGFDGVVWDRGYSLLHFAAASVVDINIVELICHLATDMHVRDDDGLSPSDYARKAGRPEVAELIKQIELQREQGSERESRRTLSEAPRSRSAIVPTSTDQPEGNSSFKSRRASRPAVDEDVALKKVRDQDSLKLQADTLQGFLYKYPTSGIGFWTRAQKRYFGVILGRVAPDGAYLPSKGGGQFVLAYWESEKEYNQGELAKKVVDMRSITAISAGGPDSKAPAAAFSVRFREGAIVKELVVVAKDKTGLPSVQQSERWASGMKAFINSLAAYGRYGESDAMEAEAMKALATAVETMQASPRVPVSRAESPRGRRGGVLHTAGGTGSTVEQPHTRKSTAHARVASADSTRSLKTSTKTGVSFAEGTKKNADSFGESNTKAGVSFADQPGTMFRSRKSSLEFEDNPRRSIQTRGSRATYRSYTERRSMTFRSRASTGGQSMGIEGHLGLEEEMQDDNKPALEEMLKVGRQLRTQVAVTMHRDEALSSEAIAEIAAGEVGTVLAVGSEKNVQISAAGNTGWISAVSKSGDVVVKANQEDTAPLSAMTDASEGPGDGADRDLRGDGVPEPARYRMNSGTDATMRKTSSICEDFVRKDRRYTAEDIYEALNWTSPPASPRSMEFADEEEEQFAPRIPGRHLGLPAKTTPRKATLSDASPHAVSPASEAASIARSVQHRRSSAPVIAFDLRRLSTFDDGLVVRHEDSQDTAASRTSSPSRQQVKADLLAPRVASPRRREHIPEEQPSGRPRARTDGHITPGRRSAQGPLSPAQIPPLQAKMKEIGKQSMLAALQETPRRGGLSLNSGDAIAAVAQLDASFSSGTQHDSHSAGKIAVTSAGERSKGKAGKGKPAAPPLPDHASSQKDADSGSHVSAPPVSKGPAGKGKPAPPPIPGQALPDNQSAVPAKSGGKGKPAPPPPPGSKGTGKQSSSSEATAATEQEVHQQPEEQTTAPTGGKGPKGPAPPGVKGPAPPAGKGPPLPGGKGPPPLAGKGPPLPGGKGPPLPGGKGPPPPAGKGPPAPGGKGAPGKGPPMAKGAGKGAKASKAPAENFRMPEVTPGKQMKPLWWSRYLFGKHLKSGATVWDKVEDVTSELPIADLENRFTKSQIGQKTGAEAKKKDAPKKEAVKMLRIINDPNLVVGKEGALRDFPAPDVVARALLDLDPLILDVSRIERLAEHVCPTPAEVAQLEECRKSNPGVPFATPEEYMWHVSRVPAYNVRLDCWSFAISYEERAVSYATALADFQQMVDALLQSGTLPRLLAMILAIGNYLNGGTNRGRADGFDLETLAKLDTIKDAGDPSRDVRHFLFETIFSSALPRSGPGAGDRSAARFAEQLLFDFLPVFTNVNRSILRDSEGTLKVSKGVRVILEDIEDCVRSLSKDFTQRHESLQAYLQQMSDPADPMKLHMAGQFVAAKSRMDRLQEQVTKCRAGYTRVLEYLNHNGMKTSDLVLLWDNLFVPGDLILNKPETIRKQLMPRFCRPQVSPGIEDFLVLWELATPDEIAKANRKSGKSAAAATAQRRKHRREQKHKEASAAERAPESGGGLSDAGLLDAEEGQNLVAGDGGTGSAEAARTHEEDVSKALGLGIRAAVLSVRWRKRAGMRCSASAAASASKDAAAS
eukprot:TRINITY_DN3389_c0_g1_i2.p1 TRINITY_DN3389_c0_g1~~TRINITY_DN3389_c0_g1_i2.p1  ORF type:complete len:1660 (-),score=346.41 TRINITY_DN3389_c0_g1_i2:293-5272(-)